MKEKGEAGGERGEKEEEEKEDDEEGKRRRSRRGGGGGRRAEGTRLEKEKALQQGSAEGIQK